jgi:hypothetical protein
MSKDSKVYARNQRASPYAGKQAQWGDQRVWWFVVLTRGKVKLVHMGTDWQQTGAGMARFVNKLPVVLNQMLGTDATKPRICFTDRGPGFYVAACGSIVKAYKDALDENGFRPFAGTCAKDQPPDVPDVLPHETVVGWVRKYFKKHPYRVTSNPMTNYQKFLDVLADAEKHINKEYDVDTLCRSFPKRLRELRAEGGKRLKH